MGLRINTNVSSIHAQGQTRKSSRETEESFGKMSSGLRINKAADDAAGLAISEKFKAEVRSARQANRNANDGLSLIQVAEGGLNESSGILTRMRELAIQSASDTMGDSDRVNSSFEYENLKLELERIARGTEFNGRKLLDGSGVRLDFQVGVGDDSADDHISFDSKQMNSGADSLGVAQASIRSKWSAQESLSRLDNAINQVSTHRSTLGSIQNRLLSSSNNLNIYTENMSQANSRIRDLDYAVESTVHAKNVITNQASTAVLAQANVSGQVALKLL